MKSPMQYVSCIKIIINVTCKIFMSRLFLNVASMQIENAKKTMKMGFDACYKITWNWGWYYVFNYFLYRMQDSKTFWCTEISTNLNLSGKTFSLVEWHDINLNVFYSRNQINYLKFVFDVKASLNCCKIYNNDYAKLYKIISNSKILVFFHYFGDLVLVKKKYWACTSEKCCLFQINLLWNFIESYFENGLVQTSKMKKMSINATHVLFENQELLKLTHQLEVFQ